MAVLGPIGAVSSPLPPSLDPSVVSIHDVLGSKIHRAHFANLDTGEEAPFLLNPEVFRERYRAVYARHSSLGLSHQKLNFLYCENASIPLTIVYDQLVLATRSLIQGEIPNTPTRPRPEIAQAGQVRGADDWRRFVLSCVTPRRSQIIPAASPPPLIFQWPGLVAMRVRILEADFVHTLFMQGGLAPRAYVVNLEVEADEPFRLGSSEVRRRGSIRPWASLLARRSRAGG